MQGYYQTLEEYYKGNYVEKDMNWISGKEDKDRKCVKKANIDIDNLC